ncbi:hypothetical protein THAOC_05239 [Thalassiosira oceanica]|uniref:Peptidylprolyl isomerase n=1 Tax=Thalassiosira oceanica TaxID=159749 RepID=K0T7U8_THAOC|nr:hypothetical protein THAOC_05239 [Thalassiosira oceanica]|eukprot:EJK73154.1 hypothetical protein THAOC_05239 [Thalassiosira oceanica]
MQTVFPGIALGFLISLAAGLAPDYGAAFSSSRCPPARLSTSLFARRPVRGGEECDGSVGRREAVQLIALLSAAASSSPAGAEPQLFKPNPLTNGLLEKIRILEQDEKDNIQYGGELESGDAKPSTVEQYVALLEPVLEIEGDLMRIEVLVRGDLSTKEDYLRMLDSVDEIISKSIFDKIAFKKTFNAYSDNIYYSDPDRANLYLGGGATPRPTQSLAYLMRNDILGNVEDVRAEVPYLKKEIGSLNAGEKVILGDGGIETDMVSLVGGANEAMVKYIKLVPPDELKAARKQMAE